VVAVSTWAAITGARPLQCYVLFCDVLFVCLSGTSSVMGGVTSNKKLIDCQIDVLTEAASVASVITVVSGWLCCVYCARRCRCLARFII